MNTSDAKLLAEILARHVADPSENGTWVIGQLIAMVKRLEAAIEELEYERESLNDQLCKVQVDLWDHLSEREKDRRIKEAMK